MTSPHFIDVDGLAALDPERLVLLDVRHFVGTDSQRDRFAAGHLPRAQFVELRSQLAGPRTATSGRNPLPRAEGIQQSLRDWGVRDDSIVVVYADAGAPAAGRAWWILTWAGVKGVRILDGGIDAWVGSGRSLVTDEFTPEPGDVTVDTGRLSDIDPDTALAFGARGQLVDARQKADFAAVPGSPDTGHIPGAVSVPYDTLVDEAGALRDEHKIRELFTRAGIDLDQPVGLTCGGGVAAAFESAVLEGLGVRTTLHVGSWTQWITDPARPRA